MRAQGRVLLWMGLVVSTLLVGLPAGAAIVTIDGSLTNQVIAGFGANINHRSWNNNELQPVLDALTDQAGMTLFRVIFDKADWEAANDNSDPEVMNWAYYDQVYSSAEFQKLWGISAYLNQKGITDGLMFNFQGGGPSWMGGSTLTPGYEAEWAEMVASLLVYARNIQHLQFHLVGPGNEEDVVPQGISMTSDQYVTALDALAQLLDANGLSDVRWVGPDLGNTSTDWLSAMMADPVIMGKLAAFGLHGYQGMSAGSDGVADFLQPSPYPGFPFWMTEFNVWCTSCESGQGGTNSWAYASGSAQYLLSQLANGASAGLVWEGYDSQYNYYAPGQWSYWGLFAVDDITATPKTYTPRKIFYTLAQITKYVRPGAQQIDVSGSASPFQLLAFYHPASGQLTVTGVNTDASAQTLSGTLANLPSIPNLELYYTDATTNLCDSTTLTVTNGSFAGTVPGSCVFTLVGVDPARTAVTVLLTNPPNGAQYTAPATIPLQAAALTTTGSISQVEFYSGATHLGEALADPYGITWSNAPPGRYALSAAATNSVGYYGVSPTVRVTVVGPTAGIAVTPAVAALVPYASQQFTAVATDALGTVISPPPPFAWRVSGGGTVDINGLFTAGDSAGGPITVAASYGGVTGTASVSVASSLNLAPAGVGYTWYSLAAATDNSPQAAAPGINDGDTSTDVSLNPGGEERVANVYEAAGVIWSTPQTINQVIYDNGSYDSSRDGVFAAGFGLQFSPDGVTWTNAGAGWTIAPTYTYNSAASGNVSFTFTGGVATVQGVRCVGRVHTSSSGANSWVAFATELQAFAAPVPPPAVSIVLTNPPDGTRYPAPASIPLAASVTLTTGTVSQVEFFCGTTNVGEALIPPYGITWSATQPGTYALWAAATNSLGAYGVSSPAYVTVVGPPAQISVTPISTNVVPYGTQPFTATVADAVGNSIDPQPAFAWSVSGGGTISPSGLFTAGGTLGGPFIVSASTAGNIGTASLTITTNVNLAPAGAGYIWYSLAESTNGSPQSAAPGLNDGNTNTDVSLLAGGGEEITNAYEAAGIVWPAPQTINRVVYFNGSYTANNDGVFAADFSLQFSPDGVVWADAGAEWTVSPAYAYNSPAAGDAGFTFTGGVATVQGVRCVGCVHTEESAGNSWVAFATELQAFAAPGTPPALLAASLTANGVVVSWPAPLTNYVLETAIDLLPLNTWLLVTNPPVPAGDRLMVTLPSTADCQLFRLHQQ